MPIPPAGPIVASRRRGPEHSRLLGRSRGYGASDTPDRLRHWHAPRINRWERLCVTAGTLAIEFLTAIGTTATTLAAGDTLWFAPGTRWRVATMHAGSRFELEVHADAQGQAEAPQPLRTALLSGAQRVVVSTATALDELARALPAGERRIVEGCFPLDEAPRCLQDARNLFWHPLERGPSRCVALIARSARAFDLGDYLGRDHAVIEASLGRALAGDAHGGRWLRATLERHLHIEEDLLFPAYLATGGREVWVRGLKHEHGYLRQYLREFERPDSRRKFLRLLDGHDEKEERVIYPDILAHVGPRVDALLAAAIAFPVPTA